jgi:uncharacterized protein DUF5818
MLNRKLVSTNRFTKNGGLFVSGRSVKKAVMTFAILACAALISLAGSPLLGAAKRGYKVFVGEIWDSACASTANHASMASVVGADPKNHAQCTRLCVENGAKYELLVDADKQISYELDDQQRPKEFSGKKVKITGKLKGEILHVEKIEAAD